MAKQRQPSEDLGSDEEFQAFLKESLSDDETSRPKGVQESGETSSLWWEESNKDTAHGTRRSSFLKSSNLASDDFAAKRLSETAVESFGIASDSTVHEEHYAPTGVTTNKVSFEAPKPLTEEPEPETSVGSVGPLDLSHTESDPVLHSTLLSEPKSTEVTSVKASDSKKASTKETAEEYEGEQFEDDSHNIHQPMQSAVTHESETTAPPLSSVVPSAHSNLLSQVQLSDTGSLDLTLQGKPSTPLSALRQGQPGAVIPLSSSRGVPIDSSITEIDEEHVVSEAVPSHIKRPNSEHSGSASTKAVAKAMSVLISDQVDSANMAGASSQLPEAGSGDAGLSDTINSKPMSELIAEMEALDSQEMDYLRARTPPSFSDRTQLYAGFMKSPYRPSSSQRTARVRSTMAPSSAQSDGKRPSRIQASPQSTLRSSSRSASKIPLYSHVRSSGYGHPQTYMPMLNRGSTAASSLSSTSRFNKQYGLESLGVRGSEQMGSTMRSTKQGFEFTTTASASGEMGFAKLHGANYVPTRNATSQTIQESGFQRDHWRQLWTESSNQVNDLQSRLNEAELALQLEKDRAQLATETIARLRKSILSQKPTKKAGEDDEGASRIALLERMLSETQKSNRELHQRMKELEAENQQLVEAPSADLVSMAEEIEKMRKTEDGYRRQLGEKTRHFDTEIKRLGDELKRARQAEADAELQAAQLEERAINLDREKTQLEIEVESLRERLAQAETLQIDAKLKQITTGAAKSVSFNVGKKAVSGTKSSPRSVNETDEMKAEIHRLRAALSLAEAETEKLRNLKVEQHIMQQQQSVSRPAPDLTFVGEGSPQKQSNERIRQLEAAVKELESILRERHPSTVPVAVLDAAAAEAMANVERMQALQERCQQLEQAKVVALSTSRGSGGEKSYQAAAFASTQLDDNDDRLVILRRHIAEQDSILARLRNEAAEAKTAHLGDQAEIVRLKGALAIHEKQDAQKKSVSVVQKQDEVVQTLLRERAIALKNESKLKAELFDTSRRLEVYEQRVRELVDQLADARSQQTPERRLFERLLDRLAELERRFQRREEVIRELRAAAVFGPQAVGSVPVAASTSGKLDAAQPNVDPMFLRSELDKIVQELHDLKSKAADKTLGNFIKDEGTRAFIS